MAKAQEVNFDGLIGPTHNYAGLSLGNVASASNAGGASSPKAAALQGLAKMRFMTSLGLRQGVLPPQQRPDLGVLRRLGFGGSDESVLRAAADADPTLLNAVWSASSMWAANAATVSPSPDTADGREFLDSLRVDQVAPVVAYLASESCSRTQLVLSAFRGRVAALQIGVTRGWISETGMVSAEDVASHLDEITDTHDLLVPGSIFDEMAYSS